MSGLIPVREYTDAAEMIANHIARRKRLWATAARVVEDALRLDDRASVPVIALPPPPPKPDAVPLYRMHCFYDPATARTGGESTLYRICYPTPIGPVLPGEQAYAQFSDCVKFVTQHFGVSQIDIVSARKTKLIARARQSVAWLCKEVTLLPYAQIARRLGDRDHTTIMHAVRKVDGLLSEHGIPRAPAFQAIARLGKALS